MIDKTFVLVISIQNEEKQEIGKYSSINYEYTNDTHHA